MHVSRDSFILSLLSVAALERNSRGFLKTGKSNGSDHALRAAATVNHTLLSLSLSLLARLTNRRG